MAIRPNYSGVCSALLSGLVSTLAFAQAFHDTPDSAKDLRNPTSGRAAVQAGATTYATNCSGCHGNAGEGAMDGPTLKSDAVDRATDGELFWFITHGSPQNGMPAWEKLSETQRWQLVDFIRSVQSASAKAAPVSSSSMKQPATGFVLDNGDVWGRPVGVTVAKDGSLLVTDDGSTSICE